MLKWSVQRQTTAFETRRSPEMVGECRV